MKTSDFLLELGCEELPPKLLKQLSKALTDNILAEFAEANLAYEKAQTFATPRRLAVLVFGLQLQQNERLIERKGPAISASEQAISGFAKSCGIAQNDLKQKTFSGADYYFFSKKQKGLQAQDLLENIVAKALKKIPITRAMRWGSSDVSFVRPVHWLLILLGKEIVPAEIMGLNSGRITYGLRFSSEPKFSINEAKNYQKILMEKAQIEVDFEARKQTIRQQIIQVAKQNNATAVLDEALLDEVCGLVEYPLAFSGKFDKRFLSVPQEALISAMKSHQKYFHLLDNKGKLLPAFISVANLKSSDLSVIISGNQRVIRPRLSDAQFFWEQDKSATLESRLAKLSSVLFMQSLGCMAEKSKRIAALAEYVAGVIGANKTHSARAGLLAKTDLVTDMVGEFADLQGVMGGHYALNDGENSAVAVAISEHYQPRFSGDILPSTPEGLAVAIADKTDSIVGIYGIGHKPTGSKDPYALKRAGLGLLRMIIESKLELDLFDLIVKSANLYNFKRAVVDEINNFISERLGAYCQEQGIEKIVVKAAQSKPISGENYVYDLYLRIQAVHNFVQDENSKSLIEANKRIKNIFKDNAAPKYNYSVSNGFEIAKKAVKPPSKFDEKLARNLAKVDNMINAKAKDYFLIVPELLKLKPVIDDFFDNVMVIDDDLAVRKFRLALLDKLRLLFLAVADFSYLSK
ncbi:MAG: glycine--tRNA ligase subunit beta [Candidatus Thioglobus sp.]|nr:glycine--tRNA ligase subunit beta [Candidatus Thioglobus sp.]